MTSNGATGRNQTATEDADSQDTGAKASAPSPQTGLNSPRTIRFLQIAVIAMAIVLVIGLATVLGRILYLYFGTTRSAPQRTVSTTATASQTLPLPQGARITTMSLSGNRLAIHFEAPTGNGIRIINTRTGAVENTIKLTPAVPAE